MVVIVLKKREKDSRERAFEYEIPSTYIAEFTRNNGNSQQGVYILKESDGSLTFVIPYFYRGHHHQLSEEKFALLQQAICDGLKTLASDVDVTLTFEQTVFRVKDNLELFYKDVSKMKKFLKALMLAQKSSEVELSKIGKRLKRKNSVWLRIPVTAEKKKYKAWTDRILTQAQQWWIKFNGSEADSQQQSLQETFALVVEKIQDIEDKLTQMGYVLKAYSAVEAYSKSLLGALPFERRLDELSSNIPPFIPQISPQSPSKTGFELITEGRVPVYLDFSEPWHLALFATTRAGKSVLVSMLLTYCLAQGLAVTMMDCPGPDGVSTYTGYTQHLGGSYLDIGSQVINMFELPNADYVEDLDTLEPSVEMERYQDSIFQVLVALILGIEKTSDERKQETETIIGLVLNEFFQDAQIIKRYQEAYKGTFGSETWAVMPTLYDFIEFLEPNRLEEETINLDALLRIKSRLKFLGYGPCRALAGVSTVRQEDCEIMTYALTNISDDQYAYVMGLMFYLMVLRRASVYKRQIVFVDEASILFKYDSLANLFGRLSANGAKFGISLWLAAQDAETIYYSPAGTQIFANLKATLVGRIQPNALETLEKVQHYPRELLEKNTGENFGRHTKDLTSEWLLNHSQGQMSHCKVYISFLLLAIVANNPSERAAREMLLEHYSDNSLEGLAVFGRLLRKSFAEDISIEKLVEEVIKKNPLHR